MHNTQGSHIFLTLPIRLLGVNDFCLRLLPTFAGVLREKNHTCASFNKIPTNYISVESLTNVLYEKNTILALFSFSVRRR